MTWQLASFAILAFALATGFWWYERAKPPAKVLALVATLAALAAIGRIAFAPLPNVKPTTDIVLIAGYVLGGAPGFVVGALTALVSNLFFGQGPYTPWQMVSWGLVGVFGALLARLFGRDLGRVPLAAACGAAGLGYGLVMDVHMWVMYSGHTLTELWVVLGRGVPFNVAHAVGNVVFCLAFGPLLVRTLLRFRERFEVRWRPLPAAAPVAAALAALVVAGGALAAAPPADAAYDAQVRYLRGVQNADGGFGATPGQSSSPMYTGWVVLGLAAADRPPADVRRNGRSPVDYLVATIGRVRETADIERTILALVAAGRSPRSVGGRDLVAELVRKRRANGSFTGLVNQTAFAILALRAAGRPATDGTVRSAGRWLARQQNADGGFNFATKGGQSGIDDTAAAVQALVAAGRGTGPTRPAVAKAAAFLARQQNPDGGFPLNPGGASNAQSAAWAIQALVAAGRDPDRQRRGGARSPRAYLTSLAAGSGAVRYSRTSTQTPVWVTAQSLTGLAASPLPIRPPARPRAAAAAAAAPAASPASPAPARARSAAPETPRTKPAAGVANDETAIVARLAPAARVAGVLVAVLVPGSDRPA